jgi:diphosphoinositol-polyphosphate diphosphatase
MGGAGYGSKGERLVAGVVPLTPDKSKVLLIQSSSRKGWVLPKGGWEKDEKTASAAAAREAWEEAGIIVRVDKDLGTILDTRQTSAAAPKACYQFFEVCVTEMRNDWPERAKRERKWFTFNEAIAHLHQRAELTEALKRSGLKR